MKTKLKIAVAALLAFSGTAAAQPVPTADTIFVTAKIRNFEPVYAVRARNHESVMMRAARRAEISLVAIEYNFYVADLALEHYAPARRIVLASSR